MNRTSDILKKKIATAALITVSIAAFATLGDGGKKNVAAFNHQKNLLTNKPSISSFKTFSLKSGYNYRGNNVLDMANDKSKYIMLNTVITYQKGNATYILPLKKKVLLDKIKFGPAPSNY
jgi:hypothetical protein